MNYNTFSLLLPFIALLFSNPASNIHILGVWKNILDPIYFIVFVSLLSIESIHFIYGPAYFLFAIFFIWLPRKWQFIIGILLIVMLFGDIGARAQFIKGLISIVFAIAIYFRNLIPMYILKISHFFFYFIAIIFLILGLTGIYNIFSPERYEGEKKVEANQVYGHADGENTNNLSVDSRTFIYIEVITSALEHNYLIFGRSPSRGNDTNSFMDIAESLNTNYNERNKNELCHLNIFTWIGIVGLLLYSIFYIQASFLALYKSHNIYVKFLSIIIAFHWAFGWIEDINNFDMMNFGLWMIIGICLSSKYRGMTDKEFELWFKSIFVNETITPYHKYVLEKELLQNNTIIRS